MPNLNGHAPQAIDEYFDAVERAARERGFDGLLAGRPRVRGRGAPRDRLADEPVPDEMLREARRLRREMVPRRRHDRGGRRALLQMNMVEKRAVQFAFPRSIFVTFNGSEYPLPVPGAHADLLHVLAAARDERQALVPAGAAGRRERHGGMSRTLIVRLIWRSIGTQS